MVASKLEHGGAVVGAAGVAAREAGDYAVPHAAEVGLSPRAGVRSVSATDEDDEHADLALLLSEPRPLEGRTSSSAAPLHLWQDSAAVAAVATCLFVLLTADVSTGAAGVGAVDRGVHEWVQTHLTSEQRGWWQHTLSNALVGGGLVTDVLLSLYLATRRGSNAADARAVLLVVAAFSVAFGALLPLHDDGTLGVIKAWVHRPRPTPLGSSFAFPSGHTAMAAFSYTAAASLLLPRALRLTPSSPAVSAMLAGAAALAATTGLGRVMGDVHWTSDVVGGAAYGSSLALWASAAAAAWDAREERGTGAVQSADEGKDK